MLPDDLKIVFQDVDGCLNPEEGEHFGVAIGFTLSAQQIEMLGTINQAIDASSLEHFVINTGRFWPILEPIAAHLPSAKLRYFICEHACVIYDRVTGQNLDLVPLAQRYGLTELAARYENLAVMRALLNWYDAEGCAAMEARYESAMPRLDKVGNLSFAIPESANGDEVLEAIEAMIRRAFTPEVQAKFEYCRSDQFIDILPGIHKLDGLKLMLAHLDLGEPNALAVGDYLNDLAIFENFDRVMCPANAHERIQSLTRTKCAGSYVSSERYGAATLELLKSLL
ncbi:MAG: HAD hydrolase family protein [Verrucomicrobiota bacterium]